MWSHKILFAIYLPFTIDHCLLNSLLTSGVTFKFYFFFKSSQYYFQIPPVLFCQIQIIKQYAINLKVLVFES